MPTNLNVHPLNSIHIHTSAGGLHLKVYCFKKISYKTWSCFNNFLKTNWWAFVKPNSTSGCNNEFKLQLPNMTNSALLFEKFFLSVFFQLMHSHQFYSIQCKSCRTKFAKLKEPRLWRPLDTCCLHPGESDAITIKLNINKSPFT